MCASCAYEPREMRSRDMTEENIQTSHGSVTGTTARVCAGADKAGFKLGCLDVVWRREGEEHS